MRLIYFQLFLASLLLAGCRSPFYANQGAALGGVTGAGVGAAFADAVDGEPLAGAAIGGVLGALTGNAIGGETDARRAAATSYANGAPIQDIETGLTDDIIVAQVGKTSRLATK